MHYFHILSSVGASPPDPTGAPSLDPTGGLWSAYPNLPTPGQKILTKCQSVRVGQSGPHFIHDKNWNQICPPNLPTPGKKSSGRPCELRRRPRINGDVQVIFCSSIWRRVRCQLLRHATSEKRVVQFLLTSWRPPKTASYRGSNGLLQQQRLNNASVVDGRSEAGKEEMSSAIISREIASWPASSWSGPTDWALPGWRSTGRDGFSRQSSYAVLWHRFRCPECDTVTLVCDLYGSIKHPL